ncbi:hypothetical protein [Dyadobacter sp. CY351]|uniref:hypothetical protein n=1 Tax=Dyadobacter sp. CY351 TaxID=2909337 RepID=UPI001F26C840|nr:hypothetical protein [Dyadobacter sp. CY351]MCF2518821.1 hypothetical protein [Dyadobacter sp. CY351]
MKILKITILKEQDSQKVMQLLQELQNKKLIQIQDNESTPLILSHEQMEEIIDESELGPFYSEEEAKAILHL